MNGTIHGSARDAEKLCRTAWLGDGLAEEVQNHAVLARAEPFDARLEVAEYHIEMTWIPSRRLEFQARPYQRPDSDEGQHLETHEWRLLRQFVDRGVTQSEHRDSVDAIDRVVPLCVFAKARCGIVSSSRGPLGYHSLSSMRASDSSTET
jgi:hypothetical protein